MGVLKKLAFATAGLLPSDRSHDEALIFEDSEPSRAFLITGRIRGIERLCERLLVTALWWRVSEIVGWRRTWSGQACGEGIQAPLKRRRELSE